MKRKSILPRLLALMLCECVILGGPATVASAADITMDDLKSLKGAFTPGAGFLPQEEATTLTSDWFSATIKLKTTNRATAAMSMADFFSTYGGTWTDPKSGAMEWNVNGLSDKSGYPTIVYEGIRYAVTSAEVNGSRVYQVGLVSIGGTDRLWVSLNKDGSDIVILSEAGTPSGQVVLNYSAVESNINYEVYVDGTLQEPSIGEFTLNKIFGSDRPVYTQKQGAAVNVSIPAGYTARIKVRNADGTEQEYFPDDWGGDYPLGTDPQYNKGIADRTGPKRFSLKELYNISNIHGQATIKAELVKRTSFVQNAQAWANTVKGTVGTDKNSNLTGTKTAGPYDWTFKFSVKPDNTLLGLASKTHSLAVLSINGESIVAPYYDYTKINPLTWNTKVLGLLGNPVHIPKPLPSTETVLSTGEHVTITLTHVTTSETLVALLAGTLGNGTYHYEVKVTGANRDLIVSGGTIVDNDTSLLGLNSSTTLYNADDNVDVELFYNNDWHKIEVGDEVHTKFDLTEGLLTDVLGLLGIDFLTKFGGDVGKAVDFLLSDAVLDGNPVGDLVGGLLNILIADDVFAGGFEYNAGTKIDGEVKNIRITPKEGYKWANEGQPLALSWAGDRMTAKNPEDKILAPVMMTMSDDGSYYGLLEEEPLSDVLLQDVLRNGVSYLSIDSDEVVPVQYSVGYISGVNDAGLGYGVNLGTTLSDEAGAGGVLNPVRNVPETVTGLTENVGTNSFVLGELPRGTVGEKSYKGLYWVLTDSTGNAVDFEGLPISDPDGWIVFQPGDFEFVNDYLAYVTALAGSGPPGNTIYFTAYWGEDTEAGGIAGFERFYNLTYDLNGGQGEAKDNNIYFYGNEVTLISGEGLSYVSGDGRDILFAGWSGTKYPEVLTGKPDDLIKDVKFEGESIIVHAIWIYAIDEIGGDAEGKDPGKAPDSIADALEAVIYFEADENGRVTDITVDDEPIDVYKTIQLEDTGSETVRVHANAGTGAAPDPGGGESPPDGDPGGGSEPAPGPNYIFDYWELNGKEIGFDPVLDLDLKVEAGETYEFKAHFGEDNNNNGIVDSKEQNIITVNVTNGTAAWNDVSGQTEGSIETARDSSLTISFTANDGYMLSSLKVDGEKLPLTALEGGSYTFNEIKNPHSIEVEYSADSIGGGGDGRGPDGIADSMESVIYFDGATGPDGESFKTIDLRDKGAATVVIEAKPTPEPGKAFDHWNLNGQPIDSGKDLSEELTVRPGETYNFEAVFGEDSDNDGIIDSKEKNAITVNVPNGTATWPDGSAHGEGTIEVSFDGSVTVTFTPDEGYVLGTVLVDGLPAKLTDGAYTFSNIKEPHTITVVSLEDKIGGGEDGNNPNGTADSREAVIYFEDPEHGTVSEKFHTVTPEEIVAGLADVNVTATPDTGYAFDHWELDGVEIESGNVLDTSVPVGPGNTYTFTPIFGLDENHNGIVDSKEGDDNVGGGEDGNEADDVPDAFEVVIFFEDPEHGTISEKYITVLPEQIVDGKVHVEVSAEPDEGYLFDHWEVSGEAIESGKELSIDLPVSVGQSYTIKAVMAEDANKNGIPDDVEADKFGGGEDGREGDGIPDSEQIVFLYMVNPDTPDAGRITSAKYEVIDESHLDEDGYIIPKGTVAANQHWVFWEWTVDNLTDDIFDAETIERMPHGDRWEDGEYHNGLAGWEEHPQHGHVYEFVAHFKEEEFYEEELPIHFPIQKLESLGLANLESMVVKLDKSEEEALLNKILEEEGGDYDLDFEMGADAITNAYWPDEVELHVQIQTVVEDVRFNVGADSESLEIDITPHYRVIAADHAFHEKMKNENLDPTKEGVDYAILSKLWDDTAHDNDGYIKFEAKNPVPMVIPMPEDFVDGTVVQVDHIKNGVNIESFEAVVENGVVSFTNYKGFSTFVFTATNVGAGGNTGGGDTGNTGGGDTGNTGGNNSGTGGNNGGTGGNNGGTGGNNGGTGGNNGGTGGNNGGTGGNSGNTGNTGGTGNSGGNSGNDVADGLIAMNTTNDANSNLDGVRRPGPAGQQAAASQTENPDGVNATAADANNNPGGANAPSGTGSGTTNVAAATNNASGNASGGAGSSTGNSSKVNRSNGGAGQSTGDSSEIAGVRTGKNSGETGDGVGEPKTGDESSLVLWMILMMISMIGITRMLLAIFRDNKNERGVRFAD